MFDDGFIGGFVEAPNDVFPYELLVFLREDDEVKAFNRYLFSVCVVSKLPMVIDEGTQLDGSCVVDVDEVLLVGLNMKLGDRNVYSGVRGHLQES